MWGSLLAAALRVLTLVRSAEVRFGVVWPEGWGAAAVKGCRGVSDRLTALLLPPVFPCTTCFCRALCAAGEEL